MIAKYNRQSLILGIPGLLLQTAGFIGLVVLGPASESGRDDPDTAALAALFALAIMVLGCILLFAGVGLYAKSKGRSPLWSVCAILGIIGLLVLAGLRDLTVQPGDPSLERSGNRNTAARISVYCGLFGILPLIGIFTCPIGFILGIVGLKRSRQLGGRGTAITGIALSTFFTLAWGGMIGLAVWSDLQPPPAGTQRPGSNAAR
jgi:hypothetical protein